MAPSQLQIKINALTRLVKESNLYEKETAEQQARVDALKANNADEYEIKKAVWFLKQPLFVTILFSGLITN